MAQKQIVDAQIEGLAGSKVSGNIPGSAANVTGVVGIPNGGTGETSAADAINALLPSQTANSGKFLTTNGTSPSWATVSGGASPLTTKGDIFTYSTVDARLPVGTNGQVLSADSAEATGLKWIAAGGSGTVTSVDMTVPSFLSVSGNPITTSGTLAVTLSGTALPIANGGTGQTSQTAAFDALAPTTTTGDISYHNGTDNVRLAVGTAGQVLTVAAGVPSWAAAGGGSASNTYKEAVRVATTANGTLTTAFANGQVVDGVTLVTNDRILIKNQTTASQNGIYTVNASGSPTRATDFDTTGAEVANGAIVPVQFGTQNAATTWQLVANGGTIGNSFAFRPMSGLAVNNLTGWVTPTAVGNDGIALGNGASAGTGGNGIAIGTVVNTGNGGGGTNIGIGRAITAGTSAFHAIALGRDITIGGEVIALGRSITQTNRSIVICPAFNSTDVVQGLGTDSILMVPYPPTSGNFSRTPTNAVIVGGTVSSFNGGNTFTDSYAGYVYKGSAAFGGGQHEFVSPSQMSLSVPGGTYDFAGNNQGHNIHTVGGVTTSATPLALLCVGGNANGGPGNRIIVPWSRVYRFVAEVIASSGGGTHVYGSTISGTIKNISGTVSMVGTPVETNIQSDAGWVGTIAVTADNTNKALIFTVTGAASTTISWVVRCAMTHVNRFA